MGLSLGNGPTRGVGVPILGVVPGSPAARAGIQPGDFLLKFGPHKVRGIPDVVHDLERASVGQLVRLTLLRRTERYTVTLSLTERAPRAAAL